MPHFLCDAGNYTPSVIAIEEVRDYRGTGMDSYLKCQRPGTLAGRVENQGGDGTA
jgi:hypothetical protein